MSTDFSITLFSIDLFRNLSFRNNITLNIPPRYPDYEGDSPYCSTIADAVQCRISFYYNSMVEIIGTDHETFSKSSIELYLYLQKAIDIFVYDHMSIFHKTLMTCAIVAFMSRILFLYYEDVDYAPAASAWAKYFNDGYKNKFYAMGGWKELENCSLTYKSSLLDLNFIYRVFKSTEDLENIRNLMAFATQSYDMEKVQAVFKERALEKKMSSCPNCRYFFNAFSEFCFTSKEYVDKLKLVEGYLHIFLLMLTVEEKYIIELELKKIPFEIDEFVSSNKVGGVLVENYSFNEITNSFHDRLKYFLTKILSRHLFVDDTRLNDAVERCLFCGSNLKLFEDIQIQEIKSVISDTVNDVRIKFDATKLASNNTSEDLGDNEDFSNDLNLFLTLGIEPRTLVSNFRQNKEYEE